jgi:hypothetical protein
MKNIFTFGIFLFFLLGIGNNVKATSFTALKGGWWSAKSTWYPAGTDTVTTPANTPVPTYTDDVTIPTGDSVYVVTNTAYCNNLTINNGGILYTNAVFGVNGNITVNTGGVFSLNSNVYCKNIYNYGKFWNVKSGNSSTKYLSVGYNTGGTTATTVASTDSCTILNDGIFGWNRAASISSTSNGCGFWVMYSNQAKAVTITHSPNLATPYVFSVCGLVPPIASPSGAAATTAGTQNQNLYIRESIALVATGTYVTFSLQNGDSFSGFTKTCTIDPLDTVFVCGYFHAKGGAPSGTQGIMNYNIYGSLDMATCNRSKNELDLYTTANSPYVAINVKNGGTLVHGKAINLIQTVAGQTTAINAETGSTVKFGYIASAPAITSTVAGVANTAIFPVSYYNLGVATGTYSVTLPTGLNYKVGNALTMTSGKLALGSNNLTAGSLSGGSATSYVVADGTGVLSTNATTSGTLFPIGTATGYAPVTITPASADTVSARVSATTTGTFTGYAVNANEWTLTPQIATTATLALTPTTATNTTTPVIFSGTGYAAKTDATLSGSTYTASGISLAAASTIFATGGISPGTAVESNTISNLLIYSAKNSLVVKNAKVGDIVTVYGVSGLKMASSVVKDNTTMMTLLPGIYIVKTGTTVQKVSVQ